MSVTPLPGQEWPEIEPLEGNETPPPFPSDALPIWLSAYIRAEALATQIPEDMAGMLVLSALSTAVQGRLNTLANHDTWLEPITLYTATVMTPGQRKSAIFERVNAPLLDWEADVQEREWPEVAASQQEYKELEQAVERSDAAIQKQRSAWMALQRDEGVAPDTVRSAEADLISLREQNTELRVMYGQMKPLVKTRLVFNDLTPEAAAQQLALQRGERIAVISDEGGVFEVLTGGRYADRLNLDVFLKGHSGNLVVVDRIGREAERVTRPMITLGLAIQPNVLQEIGKSRQMQGRGLLARFLYSVPASPLGSRVVDAPAVSLEVRDRYISGIREICEAAFERSGTLNVSLTDDAQSVFWGLQQEIEPRLTPDEGDLDPIVEWASKLAGAVLRIATLLAVARERKIEIEVTEEDMLAAVEFSEYLIAHAWRAHAMMGIVDSVEHEERVLKRVLDERLAEFTARDMYRALHIERVMSSEQFEEVLGRLWRRGYLRPRDPNAVNPKRRLWVVNPAFLAQE